MRPLEHRARPDEAGAREIRGADGGLRGPAGMQALGPGALGEVFDDAGGHRADDAERIDELSLRQSQRGRHARRRAERAEHGGWVEACLVDALRRHQARAAHELRADGDAGERVGALELVSFAHRQDCGHDHRAGMHRSALERVVEILAVRGRAVHERRPRGIKRALVAERRASPRGFPAAHRRVHVVAVPCRDAEPGDIDEELLGRLAKSRRVLARTRDVTSELLCDAHDFQVVRATNQIIRAAPTVMPSAMTPKIALSEAAAAPPTSTMARRMVPASTGISMRPAPCDAK